jgi:hypothetical protein
MELTTQELARHSDSIQGVTYHCSTTSSSDIRVSARVTLIIGTAAGRSPGGRALEPFRSTLAPRSLNQCDLEFDDEATGSVGTCGADDTRGRDGLLKSDRVKRDKPEFGRAVGDCCGDVLELSMELGRFS